MLPLLFIGVMSALLSTRRVILMYPLVCAVSVQVKMFAVHVVAV